MKGSDPRAGPTSTAAVLAGIAPPSHIPGPDRMSPSPRSRRRSPRVPTRGSALPGLHVGRPSGRRTADPAADERVLRPGRTAEEVPGSKPSLLALDEQPALPRQNEERLLIRLGVKDAGLAWLEDGYVDPELAGSIGGSPYSFANQTRRASSRRKPSASRTLTMNQPSVTGAARAEVLKPRFGQDRILAARATRACLRQCSRMTPDESSPSKPGATA